MFQLYDCRAIRLISCEAEAKAMTAVSPFDVVREDFRNEDTAFARNRPNPRPKAVQADSMLGAAFGAPIHATGAVPRCDGCSAGTILHMWCEM